jgi:DNA-binding LacI/PurR family transcriptional regulator
MTALGVRAMGVTIIDVARSARVSPSTVSRVIADHPRISQTTKDKVRQAMRELGYYPNAIARSLVNQTSNSLGVIRSRITEQAFSNPFFPDVIRGISSVARQHHLSLVLSTNSGTSSEDLECLNMLRQRQVDGVVLLASHRDDQLIPALADEEFPFVLIGRHAGPEAISWVNNDNVAAAREAAELLLQRGFERVACLAGDPDLVVSIDRMQGYVEVLTAHGLEVDEDLIAYSDFSLDGSYQAVKGLLGKGKAFTGLFCVDDLLAVGAIRALQELGVRVGTDVGVIGFNDTVLGACIDPPLTTVRVPIYELGQAAAEILVEQIHATGPIPNHRILPAQLVVRQSC